MQPAAEPWNRALGQSRSAAPRNDLPQPYRTTRDWGQLPAGTAKWAAVTAVEAAPDGSIYVIHRCAANSCKDRPEPPILKLDANGNALATRVMGATVTAPSAGPTPAPISGLPSTATGGTPDGFAGLLLGASAAILALISRWRGRDSGR